MRELVLKKNSYFMLSKWDGLPPRALPDVIKNGASYTSGEIYSSSKRPYHFEMPGVRPGSHNLVVAPHFLTFKKYSPWRKPIEDVVLKVKVSSCV